jgi:hypothetical protein
MLRFNANGTFKSDRLPESIFLVKLKNIKEGKFMAAVGGY